jgi:hypothetical protein
MRSFVLALLSVLRFCSFAGAAIGLVLTVRTTFTPGIDVFSLLGFASGAVGVWLLLAWGLWELRDWLGARWEIAADGRPRTP